MSAIWITEFRSLPMDVNGKTVQVAVLPAITTQKVTISGASAQSAAFNADTKLIRINADVLCHFIAGASPTATTGEARLPADTTEYFGVIAGQKLAAITG